MTSIRISGGRVIDPANGVDEVLDLYVGEGCVAALGAEPAGFERGREIDASGCVVCPGLVDLSARLREPGEEHKATIHSESLAAAASGITTLCMPPDTDPVIDTPAVAELVHQRAAEAGAARVEVLGALTRGLGGEHLAEMGALGQAGCVGVSNGLRPVRSTRVMRHAMEYAATFGLTVFLHAEDPWLAEDGRVHEGAVSSSLGLPGIPETAETIAVARDLLLAGQTGARVHFCHLSSARAVDMVRGARDRGIEATADVTAHHLHLSERDLADFDSDCHVRPPLRSEADRDRLRSGLADGTLAAICSDHQPHERDARLSPFSSTDPGISGLETLLPLALRLVREEVLDLPAAIACVSAGPAGIIGLNRGSLALGAPADVCIFNPEAVWTLDENALVSRGHNTPFLGRALHGRVLYTLLAGEVVFARDG